MSLANIKNELAARPRAKKTGPRSRKSKSAELEIAEVKNPAQVSGAVLAALAKRFTPKEIVRHIEGLLTATHVTKGGQKIVDNRAVEAGLKMLMAYLVGNPPQRIENLNITKNITPDDVLRDILESPAARKSLLERLIEVDPELIKRSAGQ